MTISPAPEPVVPRVGDRAVLAQPPARAVPKGPQQLMGNLRVLPWIDPALDPVGHDVRSVYVERFWLSVLGPSASWILRRLAEGLERHPQGYNVDLPSMARSIGLGGLPGRNAPFLRGMSRTTTFGLARFTTETTLEVRRRIPTLSPTQVNRLPRSLRAEHHTWERAVPPVPDPQELRRRADRLALSLLELGEERDAVEAQLHRWRFHPAMAHQAVVWAEAHHRAANDAPDAA